MAADDPDGRGILEAEVDPVKHAAENQGSDQGREDPELRGCAQKNGLGVRQQRAEVGQGTDAQEDEGRKDAQFDPEIEIIEKSSLLEHAALGKVRQDRPDADGQQEQGLEPLVNRQVHEDRADDQHRGVPPREVRDPGLSQKLRESGPQSVHHFAPDG